MSKSNSAQGAQKRRLGPTLATFGGMLLLMLIGGALWHQQQQTQLAALQQALTLAEVEKRRAETELEIEQTLTQHLLAAWREAGVDRAPETRGGRASSSFEAVALFPSSQPHSAAAAVLVSRGAERSALFLAWPGGAAVADGDYELWAGSQRIATFALSAPSDGDVRVATFPWPADLGATRPAAISLRQPSGEIVLRGH